MKQVAIRLEEGDFARLDALAASMDKPAATVARSIILSVLDDDDRAHERKPPVRDAQTLVERAIFLWGSGLDTFDIAARIGMSEAWCVQVLDAWRQERRGRP